ncbi:MAG: ribonuclease J, partial [Clostridia bacterium]|nr:ribonuclease J [Clostridia bacterium]
VEFVRVNHSVPDSCALAIKTPVGTVVFTGDFKIDTTPVDGEMIDLYRFGELGKKGVELLMMDSTNADRAGMAMSERRVSDSFEREFKDCKKRIIVASFASNVHRIQKIIEIAAKHDRKVAVSGRSMENILKVGSELGYIRPDKNRMIELAQIKKFPDDKVVIITTGSQGEAMSALYRMAYSSHRQVDVGPNDKILIAASPIPGNEKSVYHMINELIRKGAEVVYERLADIHVSGHACQEELKLMLSLIKPRFFMPVHGEYRHLKCNASLAQQTGMDSENIFLTDLGKVLEIGGGKARGGASVPSGRVLVDGYGVGDVGTSVLRERRLIGQDGVIVASAAVDMYERRILTEPFIASRGFIFVKEAEELIAEMEEVTRDALNFALGRRDVGIKAVRDAVSDKLSDFLY